MARVAVVGGGLAGCASAARLAKLGHEVTLVEALPDLGGAVGVTAQDGFEWDAGPAATALPAERPRRGRGMASVVTAALIAGLVGGGAGFGGAFALLDDPATAGPALGSVPAASSASASGDLAWDRCTVTVRSPGANRAASLAQPLTTLVGATTRKGGPSGTSIRA